MSGAHHPLAPIGARSGLPAVLVAVTTLAAGAPAAGQTATLPPAQPLLGSTIDAATLRDLPTGNGPFAVLSNIQLEAIGDLSTTGLSGITPPRFGGLLNSWTQTQYRIGDITITDPRTGGRPLLVPILPVWERVTTEAGAMGSDESAPALSMTLEPMRPGRVWRRTVEGSLSGGALVSEGTDPVPAIGRVRQWQDASVLVSGPLTDEAGLVAAGSWRGLSSLAAPSPVPVSDRLASGFARLVFAPTPRDEIRAIGWGQRAETAADRDTGVHAQITWERRDPTHLAWRLFGGYTARDRNAPTPSRRVVDSFVSAPISDLIDTGAGTTRRWTVGARLTPPRGRFLPTIGADLEHSDMRAPPRPREEIDELVDGTPARVWQYPAGTGPDVRQLTTLAVFGNEHLTYRRLTMDAGLRVDRVSGRADGAARGLTWTTWLPHVMARWQITKTADFAAVASYRRSAYQLPLNLLAVGDPAAPVADISSWNGTSIGPLLARVGPGTGGDATFVQIDPDLRRPTTDELVLALQLRPARGIQLELARITKRERPLVGIVDPGVGPDDYTSFQVPDPNFVATSPVGAPQVTVYNRPRDGYGRDRYLLTNQADARADSWGLEVLVRISTARLTLLVGGNVSWAHGPAAAVGFLPSENDQDVLGSLLVDPNAATHARGQLFQDRSHVAKIAGVYRFGWGLRLGAFVRYQDGQPFARLVIVPNLTQGPTAVRSYANGGSAFMHLRTVDLRLQKSFTIGRRELDAIVDIYNLRNLSNEVTEYVGSGPRFRTPTALQPPRTVVAGVRVRF